MTIGPLIEGAALDKVGVPGGRRPRQGRPRADRRRAHALGGTFYTPTVIADATADMRMAREEIFGPVAPLFRFKADAEAVTAANATEYGLAAYFFARHRAAWRTAEALEYGMVGLNTGLISNEVAPFGGIQQSGVGREGCATASTNISRSSTSACRCTSRRTGRCILCRPAFAAPNADQGRPRSPGLPRSPDIPETT